MKEKILAILVSFVMLIVFFPVMTFASESSPVLWDFEDGLIPDDIEVAWGGGDATVETEGENHFLQMKATSATAAGHRFHFNQLQTELSSLTIEMDLKATAAVRIGIEGLPQCFLYNDAVTPTGSDPIKFSEVIPSETWFHACVTVDYAAETDNVSFVITKSDNTKILETSITANLTSNTPDEVTFLVYPYATDSLYGLDNVSVTAMPAAVSVTQTLDFQNEDVGVYDGELIYNGDGANYSIEQEDDTKFLRMSMLDSCIGSTGIYLMKDHQMQGEVTVEARIRTSNMVSVGGEAGSIICVSMRLQAPISQDSFYG